GSGRLRVTNGNVRLHGLGVTYGGLDLDGEFQGDRLLVHRATAVSGKGTLDATGETRFVSLDRVEPKLHVKAQKFVFVSAPDLRAMASGDVDVSGTLAAPVVKGSATVGNSYFYFTQPDLVAAQGGADVQLTPADVRMMEETFGYVGPHASQLPLRLYDASDLDLAIHLERDNWLRQRVSPKMA